MYKIKNDKYYTSDDLAKYCIEKSEQIIGKENIVEYLEPSAGEGVFLNYLNKPYLAYDIEPENDKILKQDYLNLALEYKKGRCIIGNPPFGEKGNLVVQFYKKSIQLGDYIVFILPISQYKNIIKCFEFDLIYSEDLGKRIYSNRKIHCCLNIYKRPKSNLLNSKPNYKLNDIDIIECNSNKNSKRLKKYNNFNYDYAICAWGASLGKEIKYPSQYAKEFFIIIKNNKFKDKILYELKNVDWIKEYKMTATPNLLQWQVYKYLKEKISELE